MAVDYKQYINGLNSAIPDADINAAALAKRRWDSITKPLGSLGKLEEMVMKTAALTGSANVDISRRCVAMFCADNGVVAEGLTQTGSEVTAIVAANAAHGKSTVCAMARTVGAEVYQLTWACLHERTALRTGTLRRNNEFYPWPGNDAGAGHSGYSGGHRYREGTEEQWL